jgi:hypothetical protein
MDIQTAVEVRLMYCPRCGTEQQSDAQFCRRCGAAQSVASASVASTSGGAAAAVAPARIPVAAPLRQKNSNTLLKVLCGLPLLFILCWILWQENQNASKASLAALQTPMQQHKLTMPEAAFTVRQQNAHSFRFVVPSGATNVTMKGHFAAAGGSGNDIEVFVANEDEFVNWQNGHPPTQTFYNSGKVTQDTLNVTLPADVGTYYIVFSNKFSLISPKAVESKIEVDFYSR